MISQKSLKIISFAWTLFIFVCCLMPLKLKETDGVRLFENADKIFHAFLYFVFVLIHFLAYGVKKRKENTNKNLFFIVLVAIFLGICIEILQKEIKIIERGFELMDIVANSLGAMLAATAILMSKELICKIQEKIN